MADLLTGPDWLAARRERAASLEVPPPMFKGRPGWEFTDLSRFPSEGFPAAGSGPAEVGYDPVLPVPAEAIELHQVDHYVDAGVSVEDGPVVLPLSVAAAEHPELVEPWLGSVVPLESADYFAAANEVAWEGGAFVWVPRGVKVDLPILLTAISATPSTTLHRRVLIVLEEGAEAEVWEQYLSADPEWEGVVNTVVELVVGQGARLRYVCAQDLNEDSWIFGTQRAEVARDGYLDWVALGFGSGRGRVRMETNLAGQGAEGRVTGAYAPHGRQHVEYDTTQEHAAPHCVSDLAFRGVLADRSSAVWRGMIKVDPGAQQTDAFQECRNLLLTKKAHADAIPGLEILANDVRCTHAAAIAQIDEEQLFYLRARGLGEGVAKRLVIEGFLAALVERFDDGSLLREGVAEALERRLEAVLG